MGSAEGQSPFAGGLGVSPNSKIPPRLGDKGGWKEINKQPLITSLEVTAATIDLLLNSSVICLKPGIKTCTAS